MVVVYGTVCRDRFHRVSRLPGPGEYVDIVEEAEFVGGEAVNTAVALRTWGVDTVLAGNSTGTERLREMVAATGLSTDYLPDLEHFEPVCDIYVTPDGQRTMFGVGFLEMKVWGVPSLAPMHAGDWFTTDSNHGTTAEEALELAKGAGMYLYAQDLTSPGGPRTHVWQSSTDFVGRRGDTAFNQHWLQEWVDDRGGFGMLTDGLSGFVAGGRWPDGSCRPVRSYPAFPCPKMVDSTGAGDVFRAGALYGLSQDWPMADSLRFAAAAGSLNCEVLGANTGIPDCEKIANLIHDHPEVSEEYE